MIETLHRFSGHLKGRPWLFPIGLVFLVVILTTANVSGSSVGVYGISAGQSAAESGIKLGQARPVRSDEWLVRTPWLLNQVKNGLPSTSSSGIGSHDVSVVGDLPVRSLDILVRPHHITSWLLSPERALAAEWWTWHLLMICGIFALIYSLTRRTVIAAGCGVLLALSPSTQWWVAPGSFTTVGYGALAGAFFIEAVSKVGRQRIVYGVLAGWTFACFVCTLYIPWMITTAIVVGCVVVGVLIELARNAPSRREIARVVLGIAVVAGSIAAILIATFVLRHAEAMKAVNGTIYPGNRVAEVGGKLNPATLFGAPFDYNAFNPQTVTVNGTNQSENSAGIALLIPAAIVLFALVAAGLKILRNRTTAALTAVIVSGVILMSWALLPLPSYVGRMFLLDRVPPLRLLPTLSLVSVIAFGLVVCLVGTEDIRPRPSAVVVSILTFGFIQMWAAGLYRVEQNAINPWRPLILVGLICFAIGACLSGFVRSGLALLLGFSIVQFVQTNPVQVGADSLLKNPVSALVADVEAKVGDDIGWLTLGGDIYVRGAIEASGARFVSGISRYPNHSAWKILDPSGRFESAWNRYAHIAVEVGEPGSTPSISSPQSDVVIVTIDPCDARLRDLDVDVIVTQNFELASCGKLIGSTQWGDRTVRAYGF